MQLKLKTLYLFLWYLLKLKIVKNGVLWEWGFYFCLIFKRQFFGHTKLGNWWGFFKKFFLVLVLKTSWKNV